MKREHHPVRSRRKFGNIWGELDYVCKKIRYWLYLRKEQTRAKRYLHRLQQLLEELPENDMAIIRQEAWALLHELKGDKVAAIKYRQREIELIEKLHEDVESRSYDPQMKASILGDRDSKGLQERRALLKALVEDKYRRAQRPTGKAV